MKIYTSDTKFIEFKFWSFVGAVVIAQITVMAIVYGVLAIIGLLIALSMGG